MTLCIVCRANEDGPVCEDDRTWMAKTIAKLPSLIDRLGLMLLPGQGEEGPKVTTSKKDPPLPARTGALSLLAGGNDLVNPMLHPMIRRWTTTTSKLVSRVVVVDGVATIVEREEQITDYHRELVRDEQGNVMQIPDDDQIGTLPPREWLDVWVRKLRLGLGDHVPPRTPGAIAHRDPGGPVTMWPAALPAPAVPRPTLLDARLTAAQMHNVLRTQSGREVWAYLHAAEWMRQQQINRRLGLVDFTDPEHRPADPLEEEIEARFGEPPRSLAISWDVKYLLAHLDAACDLGDELRMDEFAAELQALHAEILRVLNLEVKLLWVGRCPAFIADPGDPQARKRPCGAGLWQQAGWAQVPCPRCHSVWDTRGPAGRTLNREIRKLWPVDRRRRYSAEELAALIPPRCPTCKERVMIEWREVTGTEDLRARRRWWQPRSSRCENSCEKARRIM